MKSGGGAVLLRLDFLTVLEDEADIVGAVDDGIFDKQLFIYMRKIQKRKRCMKRIKQLYMELYKAENIEKFRSIIIPIERNAAA